MSCQNKQNEQLKLQIKRTYSYLDIEDIEICYDMALSDYMAIVYPSQNGRPNVNSIQIDFFISQWLYKRMVDILDRAGGLSVTAYKENGVNFTYGGSYIDPQLVAELMPKGRVPR